MASDLQPCTKEEYTTFLRNYPNQLQHTVVGMCEPPMVFSSDFSIGKEWDAVVAKEQWDTGKYWIKAGEGE